MDSDKQASDSGLARTCAAGMALAAGLIRLLPHPWNFTPVGALGLFGGARLRSGWAYVLPLGVMAASDLLLYAIHGDKPFNLPVYICFALTVLWGRLFLRNGGAVRIAVLSVLTSLQFFLVTNFAAWWILSVPFTQADGTRMAPLYAPDLSGLVACYIAALPFARNQLFGDLFYTGLLFGSYALLQSGVLLPRRQREPAAARMP